MNFTGLRRRRGKDDTYFDDDDELLKKYIVRRPVVFRIDKKLAQFLIEFVIEDVFCLPIPYARLENIVSIVVDLGIKSRILY